MTGSLSEVLDGQREADLQRAARALLKEPLLTAAGPHADAFRLVRRHSAELREWFERNVGWTLRTDADTARLCKTPGTLTGTTHAAREVGRAVLPFTRRRYVLLCLTLAALERGESQVALGRLAEQVVLAAADPELVAAGITFSLERRDERLDLAAVVRLQLRLGVLRRVAGEEDAYVSGSGDVLYDVRRRVLAGMPAARRGPSLIGSQPFEERLVEMTAQTALPSPVPGRWRPLRIGLVDLFHYDVEEFWFRDGRLLLRGNNGTGKSKVLALTLPFLLDGDLSARRVEPDGDPGKRMEWNLLLGGRHPHPERLGYTWIEFGRLDETTGEPHFRTLLCGLKAVAGRGIARHWFAVTDQRIGAGLDLFDATGTALSRDRLAEAVAGHGMVHDTAKTYRRAVDEALFGLGERRYGALVDLLIQLRQPQLSKRPSEAALSRALTEALPPMDQAVVADAAEAFRSLDEEKEELWATREAEAASSGFLDHYRRYARIASRRRARPPRSEHARYEHLQRELFKAQADRAQALTDRREAGERAAALDERAARLCAQDAALRTGPEMRDARELE